MTWKCKICGVQVEHATHAGYHLMSHGKLLPPHTALEFYRHEDGYTTEQVVPEYD